MFLISRFGPSHIGNRVQHVKQLDGFLVDATSFQILHGPATRGRGSQAELVKRL